MTTDLQYCTFSLCAGVQKQMDLTKYNLLSLRLVSGLSLSSTYKFTNSSITVTFCWQIFWWNIFLFSHFLFFSIWELLKLDTKSLEFNKYLVMKDRTGDYDNYYGHRSKIPTCENKFIIPFCLKPNRLNFSWIQIWFTSVRVIKSPTQWPQPSLHIPSAI